MNKRITKIAGTILSALALISLALPIYNMVIGEGETWFATFRGFNLVEFSPWGSFVLILPLLLIGIAHSRLDDKVKTIVNMVLFMLGMTSIYAANVAMRDWVYVNASDHVNVYGSLVVHVVFVLLSATLFHISFSIKEYNEVALPVKPIDIYNEKFTLCPYPVKFSKFGKELPHIDFDGCISFFTEDGYFAALGHGENAEYISNGCIDVSDDNRLYGFAMRTMPFGIYGSFYEDHPVPPHEMQILPFEQVSAGEAELFLPDKDHKFSKTPVTLTPVNMTNIECRLLKEIPDKMSIDGAVVVQHGKIATVVSGCDAENETINCISAELVAVDLARMVYEQKVLEKMRMLEDI